VRICVFREIRVRTRFCFPLFFLPFFSCRIACIFYGWQKNGFRQAVLFEKLPKTVSEKTVPAPKTEA